MKYKIVRTYTADDNRPDEVILSGLTWREAYDYCMGDNYNQATVGCNEPFWDSVIAEDGKCVASIMKQ